MPVDNIETLELLFNAATVGICFIGSKDNFNDFIYKVLPDELICYSYRNEYSVSTEQRIIFSATVKEKDNLCIVLFSDGVKEEENLDISVYILNAIVKNNIAKRLSSVAADISEAIKDITDSDIEDTQVLDKNKDIDFEYV